MARATTDGRRRRGRRCVPGILALEDRALQTIVTAAGFASVLVHPGVLPPTRGRFLPVTVYGEVVSTRPETPTGFFHVTDAYRRIEPFGPVVLTPDGKNHSSFYQFAFRFTLNLQAQRSTNAPNGGGRQYDVLVGAKDKDTTDGRTVSVTVPKTYPPPLPRKAAVSGLHAHARAWSRPGGTVQ